MRIVIQKLDIGHLVEILDEDGKLLKRFSAPEKWKIHPKIEEFLNSRKTKETDECKTGRIE